MTNSTDYSKEPIEIISSSNEYSVGDKVKITNFYLANYSHMAKFIDVEGEIVKITKRSVSINGIDKADRPMYASRYGKIEAYDIIGLYVQYPNHTDIYVGSIFGFDKSIID